MSILIKSTINELIFAFSIAVLIASLDISNPVHLALENIFFKANIITLNLFQCPILLLANYLN